MTMLLTVKPSLPTYGTPEWWIQHLSLQLDARLFPLGTFDNYYNGIQPMAFATRRYRLEFEGLLRRLSVNFCRVVIETLVERVEVQGFRLGEDQPGDKEAWRIWQANNLDSVMAKGFRTAFVKGEVAAIVWRNPDDPETPLIEFHDPTEVIVAKSGRKRVAALQRWVDPESGKLFATLYTPDALFRFQSEQKASDFSAPLYGWAPKVRWTRRSVFGEDWPQANPLGVVPVIAFPNQPDLSDIGVSELAPITPIQDAINKEVADLLVASEFGAFRQRWITGIDIPTNPVTGEPEAPFEAGADNVWTAPPAPSGEQATSFGEFGGNDLTMFREVIKGFVQDIATISRMPPHYLLGDPGQAPSGESLRAAEAGLVYKAKSRQRDFDDPLEEMMRLAFRWKGDSVRAAIRDSQVIWKDPETRTESEHVDALMKLAGLGVPHEVLWERYGFSPQEISRIRALNLRAALLNPPTPQLLLPTAPAKVA